MARIETIVVGGGVGASAPFTAGHIPVIINADPASIGDSVMTQVGSSIVVGTDPDATAGGLIRLQGGVIFEAINTTSGVREVDSVSIGRGQTWSNVATDSVCIGRGTSIGAHTGAVLIGQQAVISSVGGGGNVCIGLTATISAGASNVCIGSGASVGQASVTVVGAAASCSAANGTVIGQGSSLTNGYAALGSTCAVTAVAALAVGENINISHTACTIIGRDTSFQANTVHITDSTAAHDYRTLLFGGGNIASGTGGAISARTFRFTNISGGTNNVAAGDFTLIAPLGSGTATPAGINFQTGIVGGSGAVTQTARTGLRVVTSAVAGDTDIMVWDVNSGAIARVSVGAADSGGVGFKVLRIPN
jgi:hypothetical protein